MCTEAVDWVRKTGVGSRTVISFKQSKLTFTSLGDFQLILREQLTFRQYHPFPCLCIVHYLVFTKNLFTFEVFEGVN